MRPSWAPTRSGCRPRCSATHYTQGTTGRRPESQGWLWAIHCIARVRRHRVSDGIASVRRHRVSEGTAQRQHAPQEQAALSRCGQLDVRSRSLQSHDAPRQGCGVGPTQTCAIKHCLRHQTLPAPHSLRGHRSYTIVTVRVLNVSILKHTQSCVSRCQAHGWVSVTLFGATARMARLVGRCSMLPKALLI